MMVPRRPPAPSPLAFVQDNWKALSALITAIFFLANFSRDFREVTKVVVELRQAVDSLRKDGQFRSFMHCMNYRDAHPKDPLPERCRKEFGAATMSGEP